MNSRKSSLTSLAQLLLLVFLINGCASRPDPADPDFNYSWLFAPVKEKTLKEEAWTEIQYYAKSKHRRALKRLNSPDEIDIFLDSFWGQFDPTPGTQKNEFRIEHYQRMAYVDSHYADIRGWGATDRGRVYILYGPPDNITTLQWIESRYKTVEIWTYNQTAGDNVIPLVFQLFNTGQMQFIFADKQYLGKYTQIFSTETGEVCDPKLFKSMYGRSIVDGI